MSLDARARIIVEAVAKNAVAEFQRTGAAIKGVSDVAGKQAGVTQKATAGWKSMLGALGAVTAALYTAKKAFDFAAEGAAIERLERAGDRLAASMGQDMGAIVQAIQDASNGSISRMDAMAAANRALQLGVAKTPEEFSKMTAGALALGQAMGRGPVEAINDITTGIGRMSPLILDNIGILTRGGKVYDDYAKKLGKTADQLTDTEKKQALLNATMTSAAPLLDENGNLIGDNASEFESFSAALKDTTAWLKTLLADAVTPAVAAYNNQRRAMALLHEAYKLGLIDAEERLQAELDLQSGVVSSAEATEKYGKAVDTVKQAEKGRRNELGELKGGYNELGAAVEYANEELEAQRELLSVSELRQRALEEYAAGNFELARSFAQQADDARKSLEEQEKLWEWMQDHLGFTWAPPPLRVPGPGGGAIPQQRGGPLGAISLVGEAGQELIINGVVIPHSETQKLLRLGLVPGRRLMTGGAYADGYMVEGGGGGGGGGTPPKPPPKGTPPGGIVEAMGGGGGGGGGVTPTETTQAAISAVSATIQAEIAPAISGAVIAAQSGVQQAATAIQQASNRTVQATEATNALLRELLELTERQGDAEDVGRAVRDGIQQVEG